MLANNYSSCQDFICYLPSGNDVKFGRRYPPTFPSFPLYYISSNSQTIASIQKAKEIFERNIEDMDQRNVEQKKQKDENLGKFQSRQSENSESLMIVGV